MTTRSRKNAAAVALALSASGTACCSAFTTPTPTGGLAATTTTTRTPVASGGPAHRRQTIPALFATAEGDDLKETERKLSAAPSPDSLESVIDLDARAKAEAAALGASNAAPDSAATNTVNERLQAELDAAQEGTKRGKRSKLGKKIGAAFRSERTDEERQRSIEEARNLNGVNPLVALGGSVFALGLAALLWTGTGYLGEVFLTHPPGPDAPYTFVRASAVFRNAVMGLSSLASGFAGVTGLGLLLLGGRVAYGVATGELDPTPIKKRKSDEIEMPNVLDLMLNKKPGRRGGK